MFTVNPELALAAKGIQISPEEASRLVTEIGGLGKRGNAKTEVAVSVKVKF